MSQEYDCRVVWVVLPELKTLHSEWPTTNLSLESGTTIRQLLGKLKQHVKRKFDSCEEFFKNGISGFMSMITEQMNNGEESSAQAETTTFWIIRFCTTISDANSTFNLDSGIWLRFTTLSDIIPTPERISITVQLELEKCQRGDRYHQDTSLENHVYKRRQGLSHFLIGTVQTGQALKDDIRLLDTGDDDGVPVERKNVILARFEEINGFRMGPDFRMLNTWRFIKPDQKSYFKRIGDIEGGIVCDLAFLDKNVVKLSKPYQENKDNVDLQELNNRVRKDLEELRKDQSKWDKKELEVPTLPPLTLRRFPTAQLNDPNNVLKDGVNVLAIVRMVYMVPNMEPSHHEKRVPQNCYFDDIDKNKTFWDMDAVLFRGNPQAHQRLALGVPHVPTKRVWWIMDPRQEGDIGKMYRVNNTRTQICKYIKDAPSKKDKCTLYIECHVRPDDAGDDYNENGE